MIEVMIIASIFLLPLGFLVYVQTINVFTNSTTNMRFTKFNKLRQQETGISKEFIESLIIEQKEENIDYDLYNSYTSSHNGNTRK